MIFINHFVDITKKNDWPIPWQLRIFHQNGSWMWIWIRRGATCIGSQNKMSRDVTLPPICRRDDADAVSPKLISSICERYDIMSFHIWKFPCLSTTHKLLVARVQKSFRIFVDSRFNWRWGRAKVQRPTSALMILVFSSDILTTKIQTNSRLILHATDTTLSLINQNQKSEILFLISDKETDYHDTSQSRHVTPVSHINTLLV